MATDNNEAFLGATTNSYKWNHHENAESLCKLGNLKPAAPGAEVSTHHPLKVKHSEQQQQQTDWARTWPGGAGKGKVLPFFGRSLFLSLSLFLQLPLCLLALGPFGCFCCGLVCNILFGLALSRFLSFAKEAGAGYPKGCN